MGGRLIDPGKHRDSPQGIQNIHPWICRISAKPVDEIPLHGWVDRSRDYYWLVTLQHSHVWSNIAGHAFSPWIEHGPRASILDRPEPKTFRSSNDLPIKNIEGKFWRPLDRRVSP